MKEEITALAAGKLPLKAELGAARPTAVTSSIINFLF